MFLVFVAKGRFFLPDLSLAFSWDETSNSMPCLPEWYSLGDLHSKTEEFNASATSEHLLCIRGSA